MGTVSSLITLSRVHGAMRTATPSSLSSASIEYAIEASASFRGPRELVSGCGRPVDWLFAERRFYNILRWFFEPSRVYCVLSFTKSHSLIYSTSFLWYSTFYGRVIIYP